MHFIQPQKHTRRAFLRRSGQLALAGSALPFALNLAAIGEAAAFTATDYKALVCVFLTGGNDHANTVVSYDQASYNQYAGIRSALALSRSSLTPTVLTPSLPLANGLQYALHPAMTDVARLFNTGKAATLLNVGPLVVPITKAQYNSTDRNRFPLPPKLFSHNDQQSTWQSSSAEGSTVGWGGNLGDLALSSNSASLFTCISASGNAVFLSGDEALQYQVSTNGAVPVFAAQGFLYGSSAASNAVRTLITQNRSDVLENEYNRITARSITAETQVSAALSGVSLSTAFPANNSLASQLRIVARLIAGRNGLGAKRQVFFVSLGGFDTHDVLLTQHQTLMSRLSSAISAFDASMVELGISDKVTLFTASDFGRTLTPNTGGTDHGWGSHHFVVGGAVKGRAFYGTPPPVSVGDTSAPEDQWHVGQGRLLPSTSVDQYGATLAKWFGVAQSELSQIFPNVNRFGGSVGAINYPLDLGFLA